MKIHEYQGRELLQAYGIPVPAGRVAETADQAQSAAEELIINSEDRVVVKAQVLVGGRGKAGGIKLAGSPQETRSAAEQILSLTIKDLPVNKVLVTEAVPIAKEFYVSVTVDRSTKKIVCIVSSAGGVDIEELAVKEPEKILTLPLDPLSEPDPVRIEEFLSGAFDPAQLKGAAETLLAMVRLLKEKDCSLVEINPLAQLED